MTIAPDDLARHAINARPRWITRSVERVESADVEPDEPDMQVSVGVSTGKNSKRDCAALTVRVEFKVTESRADVHLHLEVEFYFDGEIESISESEGEQFLLFHGVEYALGFIRGAITDDMRAFGLTPIMVPLLAAADIRAQVSSRNSK